MLVQGERNNTSREAIVCMAERDGGQDNVVLEGEKVHTWQLEDLCPTSAFTFTLCYNEQIT
jgi:hypothetical protein